MCLYSYRASSLQRKAPGTSQRAHKRVTVLQGGTDQRGHLSLRTGATLNRESPYERILLLYLAGTEGPRIRVRIRVSGAQLAPHQAS